MGSSGLVRALAVDASGEIWIANASGLSVVEPNGEARVVLERAWPEGSLALAVGFGDRVDIMEAGSLRLLSPSCPCRPAHALAPPDPVFERRARPLACRGLLPAVEVAYGAAAGRTELFVGLAWQLPAASSEALRGWQDVLERDAEDAIQRRREIDDSWQLYLDLRGALGRHWPPSDPRVIEWAVEAERARDEAAIWAGRSP
jgi:hypothetical protein